MSKIIKFGEDVSGFDIPVLNEREIRAAAGILFLMMFVSVQFVFFNGDFTLLKYSISIFLVDIMIRVFINPLFSPSLIIGRLIVRNQLPEYVGAQQKKFAWIIGVILAITMFFYLVVLNSFSPVTAIICLTCLIFLFFEAVFGICLGCIFYSMIYKEKAQHCPGEICDAGAKQDIQKTSRTQILVALGFFVFVFLSTYFLNDFYSYKPNDMFKTNSTTENR